MIMMETTSTREDEEEDIAPFTVHFFPEPTTRSTPLENMDGPPLRRLQPRSRVCVWDRMYAKAKLCDMDASVIRPWFWESVYYLSLCLWAVLMLGYLRFFILHVFV